MKNRKSLVRVNCSECGHSWNVEKHLCIDAELDDEIVQLIEDGLFFTQYCPNCGHEYAYVYPTIYYNDKTKTMICFVEGVLDSSCAEHMIQGMMDELGDAAKLVTARLTTTQNEFREKVMLARHAIDDRIVEILKILAMDVVRDEGWKQQFSDVRCSVSDDSQMLHIEFIGSEPRHIDVDRNKYDNYLTQAKKALENCDTPLRIDREWAMLFCESHDI